MKFGLTLFVGVVGLSTSMFAPSASAAFIRDSHWTSGNAAVWGQHSWNDSVVQLHVVTNLGNQHDLSGAYLGGAVVTSGHGLNYGNGEFATSITVRTGTDVVNNPWETVLTTNYLVHPGYNPAAGSGRSIDLGLVYCNLSSVSAALLATTSPAVGTEVEQCGFGLIYTLSGGLQQPSDNSLKLGGRNRIASADPLYPGFLITSWDQFTGFTEEWGGAPGDSGGALWVNQGGARYLAGLNTFSSGQHAGSRTGALDIAAQNTWITTNIPTPGATALAGIGLLFACRRRRHKA